MSDAESEGEAPEMDLSNSDVVTKYKAAAEISNKAIAAVIAMCKADAKIVDICMAGDAFINKEVASIFKGKAIEKGVAFPTCVSVNNLVGNVSPAADDVVCLKEGDVVKIDLGTHIDGFIATQATTVYVQLIHDTPVGGAAGNAIAAARTAFEAALRLIRPGKKVHDVAPILQKIADAFDVRLVEGVMSHEMKQFVIDGNKCVLNKPSPECRVEDADFEENEVYAIDIVVSTGEGKPKVMDEKETTVYKRALDQNYHLKLKASRAVFSEVNRRFPAMPFTTRALIDETEKGMELSRQLKLGLIECLDHDLLHAYPVLHEKTGEIVVQIKGTVLLMPNGSDRVTTSPLQPTETEKTVTDEDVVAILATSIKSKKKNKKKKDGKAEAEEAPALV
jgi:curved DNA binding protein